MNAPAPRRPDVDRDTERRNAWVQLAALLAVFAVLLYFAVPDKHAYLILVPPLLLTLGYRSWAVERFSPSLAQSYARAAVGGGADAILDALRTRDYLRDAYSRAGADIPRLFALDPTRLAEAMRAVRADRYPDRRLPGPWHLANRVWAVVLGSALGCAVIAAAGALDGCASGSAVPRLLRLLPWPAWVALVGVPLFRLIVRGYNQRMLARVAAGVRSNPVAELDALLSPPWRGRQSATVTELNRLADHAYRTAQPRPGPELRAVSLLIVVGISSGALATAAAWAC